jgi:hypothetical protein
MVCRSTGEGDLADACQSSLDCLAGLGCAKNVCAAKADQPLPTPALPLKCAPDPGTPRVFFELPRDAQAEFARLPYPNDILRDGERLDFSHYPLPPEGFESRALFQTLLQQATEDLDGFSLNPTIYFRFSTPIDLASLKDAGEQARFFLYDLTEETPQYGQRIGVAWAASTGPGSGSPYLCDNWLGLRVPWGRPLKPGHIYAAVMLHGVLSDTGTALSADEELQSVLAEAAPSDPALAEAHGKYAPLRALLAQEQIAVSEVIGATVFTTQNQRALIPAIRDAILEVAAPAPQLFSICSENGSSPCDDGLSGEAHERGCFSVNDKFIEIHARLDMPMLQKGTPPFLSPNDGGGLVLVDGKPQVQNMSSVCISITVPTQVQMPETGWPVLVYAHGTSGSFRSQVINGIAEMLAPSEGNGVVTVGFDQVVHGSRAAGSTVDPELLYFNINNPRASRAHVFQGVADLVYLARWASGGGIPAELSPTGNAINFDPEKVYLMAHSQGTHYATLMLPFDSFFRAVVLSGAGGGLILSLLNKNQPLDIVTGLKFALGEQNLSDMHPMLSLLQTYFDLSDGINYAESVIHELEGERSRPHYFHIFGLDDHYSPDATQQALAIGVGAHLFEPAPRPFGGVNTIQAPVKGNYAGVTALVRQYEGDGSYDGHFVVYHHPQAQADLVSFFTSLVADGVPEIKE